MSINAHQFGPWAVVTGASSGIGREFAQQLATAGINVVLVARRLAMLQDLGAALARRHGVDYRAVGVDLSDPGMLTPTPASTSDCWCRTPARPYPGPSWTPTCRRSGRSCE
jgi:short-subunit dehydrogenase